MGLYKKKPVTVNAKQWFKHGDHYKVMPYGESTVDHMPAYEKCGYIDTLEGTMHVIPGDWIITGIKGEHYICKDDIFEATYDEMEEPNGSKRRSKK